MGISDEKRREVAKRLRALDMSDIEVDGHIIDSPKYVGLLLMRMLDVACDYRDGLHYFPGFFSAQVVVNLFADLIDRPTCHMEPEGEGFRCSFCGRFHDLSGFDEFPWPYCPECGAEVTSD